MALGDDSPRCSTSARAAPRDDLISMIAQAERRGIYSRADALATLIILTDAGHTTTLGLITKGTLALIRHPDQWRQPARRRRASRPDGHRGDPALRPAAEDAARPLSHARHRAGGTDDPRR